MSKGFKQKQTYLGESRHLSVRKVHKRERRKKCVTKSFPVNDPFQSREELEEYLSGDTIQCLICGREFSCQLGTHMGTHNMTRQEYKKRYNIPLSVGLVTEKFHKSKSIGMKPEQIKHMKVINKLSSRKKYQPMPDWLKKEYKANLRIAAKKSVMPKGDKHHNSILTELDVINIRKTSELGMAELARRYKVSEGCISGIIKNRTWRHLKS